MLGVHSLLDYAWRLGISVVRTLRWQQKWMWPCSFSCAVMSPYISNTRNRLHWIWHQICVLTKHKNCKLSTMSSWEVWEKIWVCSVLQRWRWVQCPPAKPACFPPTVALCSVRRWDRSCCPSSAAWLTSATPFTGCHPASCGRVDSLTGWWGWWAPSHLWLAWSRWTPAAAANQIVPRFNFTENESLDALIIWAVQMRYIDGNYI